MNLELMKKIVDGAPDGSTHYYIIMFLGFVYIKYISGHPYYFHEQTRLWTKCNSFFEAKPL